MTPYTITIDWEKDFLIRLALEEKLKKEIETAKWMKKHGFTIRINLESMREYKSILHQIRIHANYDSWNK